MISCECHAADCKIPNDSIQERIRNNTRRATVPYLYLYVFIATLLVVNKILPSSGGGGGIRNETLRHTHTHRVQSRLFAPVCLFFVRQRPVAACSLFPLGRVEWRGGGKRDMSHDKNCPTIINHQTRFVTVRLTTLWNIFIFSIIFLKFFFVKNRLKTSTRDNGIPSNGHVARRHPIIIVIGSRIGLPSSARSFLVNHGPRQTTL